MPSTAPDTHAGEAIHVAAGAVVDGAGRVLIARRPAHLEHGGLWEFPGGKLRPGEAVRAGLARELEEEIGIRIAAARPLIRVRYPYPRRTVCLDVWRVSDWQGRPGPREGQTLRWSTVPELRAFEFPAANGPVLAALALPPLYVITPPPGPDRAAFLQRLEVLMAAGAGLVQLRARDLDEAELGELAAAAVALGRRHGSRVLVNGDPRIARRAGADGVHLSSARLRALEARPADVELVGASCHDAEALRRAAAIGADFAVLGPLAPTASHPGARPLGWDRFAALADAALLPVYALGGLDAGDLARGWSAGAQGIAGIGAFWDARDARAALLPAAD